MKFSVKWLGLVLSVWCCPLLAQYSPAKKEKSKIQQPLQISGVYPHLAVFNDHSKSLRVNGAVSREDLLSDGGECGIGAIVPWERRLWLVTYSPHRPNGSSDKLYSIDSALNLSIHPESVGGTPAGRMIHRESRQLIIGPYFIDTHSHVRVVPPAVMPGRLTAIARHLADPANKVYFYDMEGKIYEVNVHTLAAKKLFEKPVPGWHGKGAYTAQGQLVVANNGEEAIFKLTKNMLLAGDLPKTPEDKGVLASWDQKKWTIVQRRQFTDVTGPGGIYGSPDQQSPLWAIGWDKRSVMFELLDGGAWHLYRFPKAAHTYDHRGGWYTEWPRIREVANGKMLMDMHAMLYDFPRTFSYKNSAGVRPVNTHLRYIPDFCSWNNKIVIATDETTMFENPMAGRAQSNLWFGTWDDLKTWGPSSAWGGVWMQDAVKANVFSDPFLINGFDKKILHLSDSANGPVHFTLQIDKKGNNQWSDYTTVTVPMSGYANFIFPKNFSANWIRIKADKDCIASAFFHYEGSPAVAQPKIFAAIAGINDNESFHQNLIRPAAYPNTQLQVLNISDNKNEYEEVDQQLRFLKNVPDSTAQMKRMLAFKKHYVMDNASVIVTDKTGTFRLPFTSPGYESFQYRDERETESERFMLNAQGTFYEVGRESGFAAIRPITTHKKKIVDFCTWRGLLVISGTKKNAKPDGHYFGDGGNGLWFGGIDDLWKMGKPVGEGGVWKDAEVKANAPSLPFLMTGYDKKSVTLSADKDVDVTLEVDFDLTGFHLYKTFSVKAGKKMQYTFPEGFNAHWVRAVASKNCKATVWFKYE
ncbi:MAG: hypothetical protein J7539_17275 [Niabella sp.]|nr:hypothetical protein [Niabella sp.]